jgi:hypothetical protein
MFRGKTNIPYKLYVQGDQYEIRCRLRWRWAFFKGFMSRFRKDQEKELKLPDTFEAKGPTHPFILKCLQPTLEKIIKTERKNIKGFVLLSSKIDKAVFKRAGEDITLNIIVSGWCKYDL